VVGSGTSSGPGSQPGIGQCSGFGQEGVEARIVEPLIVLLTRAGREMLVAGYEHRMLQHTRGALPGLSGSLRRHLYRQAERLAAIVHDPDAS
jgi:hypothetical protein